MGSDGASEDGDSHGERPDSTASGGEAESSPGPDGSSSGGPDGASSGGPGPDGSSSGGRDAFEFESYYELLGVPEEATTTEIEQAYRAQAKRYHPDASDEPEQVAERRFRHLLTAREVLTSVERRRAYDELGHEQYRRQSESLGEPVRQSDPDPGGDVEPEPRPDPGAGGDRPGQVQRSARGEAHRRGDPLVTDAETAFGGPPTGADGPTGGDEGTSKRGIYRLVFEDDTPESRSLHHVATRWARSWRTRVAVAVGSVLLVAGVLAALPAVLDAAVPDVTAGLLYAVALVAAVAHTGFTCVAGELRLPRGQFLADRDHGRFSTTAGRRYRRRGLVALVAVFLLALASARNGVDPWADTASALRGDLSGSIPWVDAPDAGWTGALDAVLSGAFAVTAVVGTCWLAVGASIALWHGRYERGLRVRPSLWEPVLVATLVSVLFALAAGPVALASPAPLSALPEPVALAAGIDGATVTPGTVATAGIVLSAVSVSLLRVRTALGGRREEENADDPR
jgi:hypothetical protein